MIYLDYTSMDAAFWFGLENALLEKEGDYFLFWRTRPTVMLGAYQTAAEFDHAYVQEKGIAVVRRQTGGGTIYTDPGSWQFSYICNENTKEINFAPFVQPVLEGLRNMGLDVSMSERNDLLIEGRKFSGNAQHHAKGRILHHGSILFDTDIAEMVGCLRPDNEKLTTKSIRSVSQRVANLKEFLPAGMNALSFREALLSHMLTPDIEQQTLLPEEAEKINKTFADKYKSPEWVYGQSPAFTLHNQKRFSGGKVEMLINLNEGKIAELRINGDFFYPGDIAVLTKALAGCLYTRQNVWEALQNALKEGPFYKISANELLECLFA